MRRVDPALYEYCTAGQLKYLKAINEHRSMAAAARALGVNSSTVEDARRQVEKKAAIFGYSPQHDLTKKVAPGFIAKGHSTLYRRGEPEPVIQWVKTKADDAQREKIIRSAIDALMQDTPRAAPAVAPKQSAEHLCTVYTLTDCHVGMKAWGKETGADWDLAIAERTLVSAFDQMVMSSPTAAVGVVAQLGDWIHTDGLAAVTPTSGHQLDADSRFSKIVAVAVRVLRRVIDLALQKHSRVIVLMAEGNHDVASSVWLRHMFQLLYEQEPRITVIDSELPYYVYQHGSTFIGWHHGHLKKPDQLPLLFAAQFPKEWGATTRRYVHCGHLHHVHEKEHSGVTIIQHPTIAARDAYAARGGWVADRSISSITYHAKFGQVGRTTVVPEMLMGAA
jgi:hypothetical protein